MPGGDKVGIVATLGFAAVAPIVVLWLTRRPAEIVVPSSVRLDTVTV
jgi:hypothetical protein